LKLLLRCGPVLTTSSAGAQAKTGPPRTVLVIDGNEEHAILSVTALGRKGFRVISAEGGKEGVRIALAQPFDAIVVGHKLRDATGLEVLRILADKLPVRLQLQVHKIVWPGRERGI